jgi:hypothetical protein
MKFRRWHAWVEATYKSDDREAIHESIEKLAQSAHELIRSIGGPDKP